MCLQEILGEGTATLATLHGSITWLCQTCTPNYRMMTVMSQGGAQSRPVSRRQITVTSRPAPAPATEPEHVTATPPVDEIADRLANMHMSSQGETQNSNSNPSAQEVPATDQTKQTVSGPPTQGVDCPLFIKGDCSFGISGRRGGVCTAVHRKRCTQFLRWGSKGSKGCKGDTCNKLHPLVCPASLDLLCTNQSCSYNIHVNKCKRKARPPSYNPQVSAAAGKRQGKQPSDRPGPGKPSGGRKIRPMSGIKCSECDQAGRGSQSANAGSRTDRISAKSSTVKGGGDNGQACCQPSNQADLVSSVTDKCVHGQEQSLGFQVPTVQPLLETWLEGVRKEMNQKQEFMFQMMRMEMMQARNPMGRGAFGLLPSF